MCRLLSGILLILLAASAASAAAEVPAELATKRSAFQNALLDVDIEFQEQRKALQKKYLKALVRLEKQLQQAGNLDGVLAIQKERKSITDGKSLTDYPQPDHANEVRGVYLESLNKILASRESERASRVKIYRSLLDDLLVSLTKVQRLNDAIAVQAEMDSLKTLATPAAGSATISTDAKVIERLVPLPKAWPPVVSDPFSKTKWTESMTVPSGKYRLREPIGIGSHGKGPLIHFAAGGDYSHSKGKFHVWGGRLMAEQCSFSGIPLRSDHTGGMFFINCRLDDCTIKEEGTWYGYGNYDSVWYFENCMIDGSLHPGWFNVHYLGLCMSRCSLSRVDLPSIWYRNGEPASLRQNKWLRVRNCRFYKCKVPLSFLSITSDCAFVDCRFEDDSKQQAFSKPFEVIFYTEDSTNAIRNAPAAITLTEKPLSDLVAPYGSILPEG